jgi:hypothetical protein
MLIEYDTGCVWTCDSCGLETEDFPRVGPGSVVEAVAELRQRGWLIGRLAGEWTHYCASDSCRKARAEKSSATVADLLSRSSVKLVR